MKYNSVQRLLRLCVGFALSTTMLTRCSTDWPAFRHDIFRTGAQLNHGPLTDPAKVQGLHIAWSFPSASDVSITPDRKVFRASPIVYKNVVYIGNANGHFYAINAADGKLKWQYPPAGSLDIPYHLENWSGHGIASSAAISKIGSTDVVIFGAPDTSIGAHLGSGRLFALDAQTGAVMWKSPELAVLLAEETREQIGYSSPLVVNDRVYVGIASNADNPIQRGKVVAVRLADGTIDHGFNFVSTGLSRGGGVWGSVAAFDALYVTTGNVNTHDNPPQPEPVPDHGLSLLRLNWNTGDVVWQWQPVPYVLDDDVDWSATPSIMLASCGPLVVSTQKDGWTWALNTEYGDRELQNPVRWAFPPGPWVTSGFHSEDGTAHGDTKYIVPGAVWDDIYITLTGGAPVTSDVLDGFNHLYALDACASSSDRVRWIKDVPNSSGSNDPLGSPPIGPPTVTHGMVFVGTDQGHLVVIGDPIIVAPDGWRCSYPLVPSDSCVANGFALVPDPRVLADIDLACGPIHTEPAIVGDAVYVSTDGAMGSACDGGKVFRLDLEHRKQ